MVSDVSEDKFNMKNLIKIIAPLLILLGIFKILIRKKLIVFNYHEISENPSEFCVDHNLNVTPKNFELQVKLIKKYFNVITPLQLVSGNYKLPAAVITFDDGFQGAFINGGRILKKYNLSAIIFMNMAPLDGNQCWSGLVSYLCKYEKSFTKKIKEKYKKRHLFLHIIKSDIDEFLKNEKKIIPDTAEYHGQFASIYNLRKSFEDGIYLGNHLYNHYNSKNLTPEQLKKEYLINQEKLSIYKNSINMFSYPFGQPKRCFDSETNKLISELGAVKIFTAYQLFNKSENIILNRTAMYDYVKTEAIFKSVCITPCIVNSLFSKNIK